MSKPTDPSPDEKDINADNVSEPQTVDAVATGDNTTSDAVTEDVTSNEPVNESIDESIDTETHTESSSSNGTDDQSAADSAASESNPPAVDSAPTTPAVTLSWWQRQGALWASFVAVVALLVSGWIAYQQWVSQQQTQTTVADQSQQIQQQNQLITMLERSFQQTEQAIANKAQQDQVFQDQLTALRQQLVVTQDKLRLLSNQGKQEWLIEQVYFYLELAQRKLMFEQQINTAIALLNQADQSLLAAADLGLNDLRQAISDDRTALAAINPIDRDGLMFALSSLRQQMDKLEPHVLVLPSKTEPPQEADATWFDSFISSLDNFAEENFEVTHHQGNVPLLLDDKQQSLLNSALKLSVLQLELAVVNQDRSLYDSQLSFIQQALNQYYKQDQTALGISQQLQALTAQPIEQSIDYSLISLSRVTELREQRRLQWLEQSTDAREQ